MKLNSIYVAIVSSLLLAAISYAEASASSNKWRIEMSGQALTSSAIVFRVTPRHGESVDVSVAIRGGREENNVAKFSWPLIAARMSELVQ